MTKSMERCNRVLGVWCRAAAVALALAVVLLPLATSSAQAQTYSVLYAFGRLAGDFPTGLIRDSAGNLYGTTQDGAFDNWGAVFKVDPAGQETTLYCFTGQADGGTPEGGLVMDGAGNLYGTTYQEGDMSGCGQVASGCGVVFKLDTTGRESVLYTFTGGADGGNPFGGVIMDEVGNLYGTTLYGGDSNNGVVFRVDTTGEETVLYTFTGGADGGNPQAGLVMDQTGNLYGTTQHGGSYLKGTVFKLATNGEETVLHSFHGPPDGAYPIAGVVLDAAGNLYGTTFQGGDPSACFSAGCGVVFKLDSSSNETVLYSFTGGTDGSNPEAGVVLDSSGNLYGTTFQGGDLSACFSAGCGVVFQLSTTGIETVLHSFGGDKNDGANPIAGLVLDDSGNLYGTTEYGVSGGTGRFGTAFKVAPLGFLLSASALTPGTVNPGASSSSTVKLTATGGFNGSIALACSVQPTFTTAPECSISPSSITPGKTALLTVTTGSAAGTMSASQGTGLFFPLWIGLIVLGVAGLCFGPEQERAGGILTATMICLVFVFGLTFEIACGGGSGSRGTPRETYTITVTGTSQSSSIAPQMTQLSLTVQ